MVIALCLRRSLGPLPLLFHDHARHGTLYSIHRRNRPRNHCPNFCLAVILAVQLSPARPLMFLEYEGHWKYVQFRASWAYVFVVTISPRLRHLLQPVTQDTTVVVGAGSTPKNCEPIPTSAISILNEKLLILIPESVDPYSQEKI